LVKYVKASKQLKVLIETIFNLLPGIIKIGSLIVLITAIFSILGMNFYYNIQLEEPLDKDNINFQTFTNSFTLLIFAATGDVWYNYLEVLVRHQTGCKAQSF
jgi:p-aminobenzoyl-glutamate transporter AbgT